MSGPRDKGPGPEESAAAWADDVARNQADAPIPESWDGEPQMMVDGDIETSITAGRSGLKGCLFLVLFLAVMAAAFVAIGAAGGLEATPSLDQIQ